MSHAIWFQFFFLGKEYLNASAEFPSAVLNINFVTFFDKITGSDVNVFSISLPINQESLSIFR